MKQLANLPHDIDVLFYEKKGVDEQNLQVFLKQLGDLLRDRLTKKEDTRETIRMSKLGIPNLKLWYEHNEPQEHTLESSKNSLKFIYGDIIEQLIVFLAKEAGHTVEEEQQEVEIDGIKGHKDGKIDGVTIDVKSASRFAFPKFSKGTLLRGDDPFGYRAQLSAYMDADSNESGAFIGVNKESGEIAILPLEKIDTINPRQRIKEIRAVLASPVPPTEKCYQPVPQTNTSNNLKLHKNCEYCPFKFKCWKDANDGVGLRVFDYAGGLLYLTHIDSLPRVTELQIGGIDSNVVKNEE